MRPLGPGGERVPEVTPGSLRIDPDGVAALCIASDAEPYLGVATIDHLAAACEVLAADRRTKVLVLTGGGRHFSAGARVEDLADGAGETHCTRKVGEIPRRLLDMPVPTIAAMAGHAVGGGLVLGLWCDLAVLAEESLYGANFVALGFTPGMGATVVLEEAVGTDIARDLLLTGRLVKGRQLFAGNPGSRRLVPRGEVVSHAFALAREIAEAPRDVVAGLKAMLSVPRRERLEAAMARESAMHQRLFADDAVRAHVRATYAFAAPPPPTDSERGWTR